MAINSIGQNAALFEDPKVQAAVKDQSVLGKDDFMTLLLAQLQHQDPTEPMDSEKILTQTSQLAGLEATENTNKALESLAKSLGSTNQFATIAAIGKTADLGSNSILLESESDSTFEVYFSSDVKSGTLDIRDKDNNIVKTVNLEEGPSGTRQFTWDGRDNNGNLVDGGLYNVGATFTNADGQALATKLGAYPIESVKFDQGQTLVKLGSSYVPLENVKEVY